MISLINMKGEEWYRTETVAKMLDVNIMTIYRYLKAGRLVGYKIGKEYRIKKVDYEAFLESVKTK
jgi:excisionase family DNA binding protein